MIQVLSMNLCTVNKCCVHVRYMYEIKEHNIRVSQTENHFEKTENHFEKNTLGC